MRWRAGGDSLNRSAEQLRLVDGYALLYGVRFMGSAGQRLNGNTHVTTDPGKLPLLKQLADELYTYG